MMRLLFIFSLLIVVYGEAPADPGYAYPPPPNEETSLPEETPIEDINRFIYFFKSPVEQKKTTPQKPTVKPPPPKKNYKIIFIKAPEAPVPPVPPVPVPPQNEEKTIVYVLSKKPEEEADVLLPTPPSTKPPAPEVYFINYGIKKDSDANENGGYDYSSESATTQAPTGKPLLIPNEYLPPKEPTIPEVSTPPAPNVPGPNEISSEAPQKAPLAPPTNQYGPPNGKYSSQESTNTAQSGPYSSSGVATNVASAEASYYQQAPPLNLLDGAGPPAQLDIPTSFASDVASQYGPPKKNAAPPPRPPQAYLPPKTTYGVPDVALSLSSKSSSSVSTDESGRYLPPSTSYGVPDPGIRLSRSSRYSPPRSERKVYQESDPSLEIIKGVYDYYGP